MPAKKRSPEYRKRETDKHLNTRKMRRRIFRQLRSLSGCRECGENHPATLEYHHRNPEEKSFSISQSMGRNIESLFNEIAKCDVLCSNCHAKATAEDRRWGVMDE